MRLAVSGDYPRACGGTPLSNGAAWKAGGLSPRMRGNRSCLSRWIVSSGTIPAHAGEPTVRLLPHCQSRDYPRACGGTIQWQAHKWFCRGLSPRMRGNPDPQANEIFGCGTIPAHAGEPHPDYKESGPKRDYPRACGGTNPVQPNNAGHEGLSPRMRGNPRVKHCSTKCAGTIPAHAGEPGPSARSSSPSGDYPRACGGTWTVCPLQ